MFIVKRIPGSYSPLAEAARQTDNDFQRAINEPPPGYTLHTWQYLPCGRNVVREYIVVFKKRKTKN